MNDFFSITEFDIIHLGRSPGGDRFTGFINDLIRAEGLINGIPLARIHTNLRTTIPDGGVDAKVDCPMKLDSTGWLSVKTIWQYKATEFKKISQKILKEEVNKPYAKQCIMDGYGYRFCICDSLTPEKKDEWERILTDSVKSINQESPEVHVLSAGDIAVWSHHYPAIILHYFRLGLAGSPNHIDAWGTTAKAVTPVFIPIPTWEPIIERIKDHVNMSIHPAVVSLTVQGEAGVGKTRMVYEILAGITALKGLVLYTNDESHAREISRYLANDSSLRAILVADECSLDYREQIKGILQGHHQRIRVIAIDNTGERPPSGAPENWMDNIPQDAVEKILERNFHDVPTERRRAYTSLSGGFVRLAADMCEHHHEIEAAGHVGPVISIIRDYLCRRVNEELYVIEGISLVSRIGYKSDVAEELDHLCALIRRDRYTVQESAVKLHDAPGFVVKAGRYFYVTPEIVAQVAFEGAWRRWIADDPEGFFKRIPYPILEAFLKRVSTSGSEKMRKQVGLFFSKWVHELQPIDLSNPQKVNRFITLIETAPDTYFPLLFDLVERATPEELLSITGHGDSHWGPRRYLVWLVERLIRFPQFFNTGESILLKFSLEETEQGIGNNAASIWKQVFAIFLSGTAIPFQERLNKLKERIYSEDEKTSNLALDAFDGVFTEHGMRILGPSIIAGRILPDEWNPKTYEDRDKCHDQVVSLLRELTLSDNQRLIDRAYKIAIYHMRTLLYRGYVDELKNILVIENLTDEIRVRIIEAIEKFLHYEGQPDVSRPLSREYIDKVNHWMEMLKPTDFHSRLVTSVAVDTWHYSVLQDEKRWKQEIQSLAKELYENPDLLRNEMEWLCSKNAKSTTVIGEDIGKLDTQGLYLEMIIDSSVAYQSAALARGYIYGLLNTSPLVAELVNALLDRVEESSAVLAYEIYMVGGDITDSLSRTLKLIDFGKLPTAYLNGFVGGFRSRSLTVNECKEILKRLVSAVETDNSDSRITQIATEFVAYRITDENRTSSEVRILNDHEIQELVWHLLELSVKNPSSESYWWEKILKSLLIINPNRAAGIAVDALFCEGYNFRDMALKTLIEMPPNYSDIVIHRLGEAMLDDEKGWHFHVYKYTDLIQSLPDSVIIHWINSNGVEAAYRLARHLPPPYLNANGEAIVPDLTRFVLETFEEDERVFNAFCAGIHSFQMYSGDIASQHEQEGRVAQRFKNHQLRRIREWAQLEMRDAQLEAERWHQVDEERGIE